MLETLDIVDVRAAAVFASPRQRGILFALIEMERSLSQLAKLTELPLSLLHHHVRKFVRLGLVEIAREQPRAGAPIKVYRARARAFFLPSELMHTDPGAGSSVHLRELLERSLTGTLKGALYSCDGGGPQMRLVREPGPHSAATELWLDLRLSDADAACLAEELRALLGRFRSRQDGSGRRYLVHAALAAV